MEYIHLAILIVSCICLLWGTFNSSPKINWTNAGLFLFVLSFIIH